MDIRNFFGKASKPGKKKQTSVASSTNDNSTSSSRNPSRSAKNEATSNKTVVLDDSFIDDNAVVPRAETKSAKTVSLLDDSSTDDDVVVPRTETKPKTPPTKKRFVLEDDNDSSTTGDEAPVKKRKDAPPPEPVSASPKKPKKDALTANRTEISAQDFFAKNSEKTPKTTSDTVEEEELPKVHGSPPQKEERRKRERPLFEDEEEIQPEEPDVTTASPVTPPSAASTPAKKKRRTPKSTKKEKEPLLEPMEPLKSFSSDEAAPECLSGLTFVFTGVLPNLPREEAQDYIKILGGRVTGSVSGRTSYLVVGDILEDGRPYTEGKKYLKATELNVIVVKGEEQLYGLTKLYSDKAGGKPPCREPVVGTSSTQEGTKQVSPPENSVASPPVEKHTAVVTKAPIAKPTAVPRNPYAKPANPYAKKAKPTSVTKNPYASRNPYASKTPKEDASPVAPLAGGPNALWADKYAPQSTRDILGNQESVRKLSTWLTKWESTFNNPKAQGKSFAAPGGPRKAALLSGPPGIGKTTTALLVAREAGRDTLEFNASDVRSKKALSEGLGDVTGSQVLNFGTSTSKKKSPSPTKRCIIMDEVDGMGAGDRSGMAELIKMIKSSKAPIICICNDRQSQKVKSLVPYCLDLRYKRPVKTVIARRAVRIGEMEGMKVEMNAAEAIAESCGNDIRQVLNCLQMWSNKKGSNLSMTYKDVKERKEAINKDEILRVSLFDATRLLVEGRKGLTGSDPKAEKESLYKRSDAYFVDYSLMGLMVQQNYLKVMTGRYQESKRTGDEDKVLDFLENMNDASSTMSDFAVAEHDVRSGDQNWGLLPLCGMLSVKTGYHAGGEYGSFLPSFPEFAGWMGKNSTRGKKVRLLQELRHHVNYKVSGDSRDFRLCYVPALRDRFLSLMTHTDGAKTTETIELMDEYGLDRDDVFEYLDEFKMDNKAKSFSSLDSKQKAAFTREYSKGSHKSQALVDEQGVSKTRKKKGSKEEADPADPDAVNDDAALQSSGDDDDDKSDSEEIRALFATKKRGKGAKKGGKRKKG